VARTDAQGRPELLMHPDIVTGCADYRFVEHPEDLSESAPPAATSADEEVAKAAPQQKAEDGR